MRRRWQRSRDRMDFIRYGLLMAALALGLWWADSQMRPAIRTMAAYQAKVYATEAINRAVADYMTEWEAAGGQAVTVTYGERGEVAMVQADMAALNALRTAITAEVTEEIARLEEQDIKIPIGTFLGGQIFSGRGPKIVLRWQPTGYVRPTLKTASTRQVLTRPPPDLCGGVCFDCGRVLPATSTGQCLPASAWPKRLCGGRARALPRAGACRFSALTVLFFLSPAFFAILT